jgi:hypothetical protein
MELPLTHPKRAFMHRLIEMEIRLAYHDRIMESLPPAMQLIEDMHAPALQPTDPLFPYENKGESRWRIRSNGSLIYPVMPYRSRALHHRGRTDGHDE